MTSNVPTSFVRAYLRASTAEQDASRALETIEAFARERGLIICSYYIENESGTRLERPELFRLLRDCQQNDILLIEDVDRLSRLSGEDWNTLKKMIRQKDIRVMAVNVPTTWINSGIIKVMEIRPPCRAPVPCGNPPTLPGAGAVWESAHRHCCKVSDEAAFCLIQRPYISKTLLTRRISPRGSP